MWLKKNKKAFCSTVMRDKNNILEIDNLKVYFNTDAGLVKAVDGVTIDIPKNATIGIVGESGCGKSVTSLAAMRLLQEPPGKICDGEIRLNLGDGAIDIVKASQKKMGEIRGKNIAMIFQEPMTSLNPVFTIGEQIQEGIIVHEPQISRKELAARVLSLLDMVGIARPEGIVKSYPHELSGGMKQRIVIAMALSCNPSLIIADEPTTALDVTIQAQVLELMRKLQKKTQASIMLITHDLGVVAEMADYVVVMYAGRVVEQGTVMEIFKDPRHPYTRGLLKSRPSAAKPTERLFSISGNVPNPVGLPNYCYFKNRCVSDIEACEGKYPVLRNVSPTHKVSCHINYDN